MLALCFLSITPDHYELYGRELLVTLMTNTSTEKWWMLAKGTQCDCSSQKLSYEWAWISGRLTICTPTFRALKYDKRGGQGSHYNILPSLMHGNVPYPSLKGMLVGDGGGPYSSVLVQGKIVDSKIVKLPTDSSA